MEELKEKTTSSDGCSTVVLKVSWIGWDGIKWYSGGVRYKAPQTKKTVALLGKSKERGETRSGKVRLEKHSVISSRPHSTKPVNIAVR